MEARRESLRAFHCAYCGISVLICSKCDHGNTCCSKECSKSRRRKLQTASSSRYQKTDQGAANHQNRQQQYRKRNKEKNENSQSVTHHASTSNQDSTNSTVLLKPVVKPRPQMQGNKCCCFCGMKCNGLTRRNFIYTKIKEYLYDNKRESSRNSKVLSC